MSKVTINNALVLDCPDSFKEMGEEELTKYFGSPQNRWGAYNADEHIILSVGWRKAGIITDAEMALIDIESRMRRSLLNYQRVSSYKTPVITKKNTGYGIRFEYRVNDSVSIHAGDLVVFKHKNRCYAIEFVTRKSHAAQALPAFEEILKSIAVS